MLRRSMIRAALAIAESAHRTRRAPVRPGKRVALAAPRQYRA
jgi:hypothetical protein